MDRANWNLSTKSSNPADLFWVGQNCSRAHDLNKVGSNIQSTGLGFVVSLLRHWHPPNEAILGKAVVSAKEMTPGGLAARQL